MIPNQVQADSFSNKITKIYISTAVIKKNDFVEVQKDIFLYKLNSKA